MMYYQNKQTGFSLVETLVAVSILLIVIVGPMTISARTAKSSSFASEQVQAFFLAQEGLELAQKARDDGTIGYFKSSATTPKPWDDFTKNGGVYKDCFDSKGCGLQWLNGNALDTPLKCNGNDCLIYRSVSGRSHFNYTSTGNIITPFTRKIYFEKTGLDPAREVRIRSVVTWRTGSIVADQKVEVDTYLYNIYDTP
jgi:prepilin-type N-terminal cleavage/methylation domain-containing protein